VPLLIKLSLRSFSIIASRVTIKDALLLILL